MSTEQIVWCVFAEHRMEDRLYAIWSTEEAAQKHVDQIERDLGLNAFVEDWPLHTDECLK